MTLPPSPPPPALTQEEEAYFTPLWKIKGTQSFAGNGVLQPPASKQGALNARTVEDEGFQPLRKARTETLSTLNRRFSFNSRAAKEGYAAVWEKRDPWRMLKKNVSFAVPAHPSSAKKSALSSPPSPVQERRNQSVVVVDPFSSGAILARRAVAEGFHCIRVLSEVDSPVAKLVQEGMVLEFDATFQYDDRGVESETAIARLVSSLKALPWAVVAVLAGAEPGVEIADILSNRLGLDTNGEELSLARRNKYEMGERVRSCGPRAVQQRMAHSWDDVETFFTEWTPSPFRVVVKPLESAGSDDVYLCHSKDEVRDAFDTINGKINGLGCVNEGALVQEFLDGTEYVIDSVSRDGVHKVVAIWEYDKRSVNGANFVYFGMKLNDAAGEREAALCDYALTILDAMGVKFGPGHMEIKYTQDGPCLVEVGTRCHGGEGTWQGIANACVGYNQIDSTFDSYCMPELWEQLPPRPTHLLKAGREVFFVAREQGMLRALPGLKEIQAMPSFVRCEVAAKPRDFVYRTVDCFTRPGSAQLVHGEEAVVLRDYERVRELERYATTHYVVRIPCTLR
eukprot:TRINITY_DN1356_c0_g1_i4.p1 TRINITY_DN1356_c0_g1~~TRINITY_DN1356_c0_g1_i4.p1  ORF type:complete len:605 (-),score=171.92 TRINITY_DN1356_c0_g1_i4:3-1703(-)